MGEKEFMRQTIELSRRALGEPGTEPFGAIVVKAGTVVGAGLNHAAARFDPTSHGEVEAIRDPCRKLRRLDLSGCDLYTSCEPCALCVAAMQIVGIRRLFYAASLDQSTRALAEVSPAMRLGIDTADLQEQVGLPVESRRVPARQLLSREAVHVLELWARDRR